jgi:hypothetical protein
MKTLVLAATLAATLITSTAYAACPAGTRYDCYTTFNGKQSCGCR